MTQVKKQRKPRATSAKTDPNKLTLTHVLDNDKKYDQLEKVTFDDGRYTEIYTYFRPSKIETMLEDLSNFLMEYKKVKGVDPSEKQLINYIHLHIAIHFSTLIKPKDFPSDIHEKADIFTQMLDSEYLETIFDSFNKEEVQKVYALMYKKVDALLDNMKASAEMRSKLKSYISDSDLQNKDIIEKVFFGDGTNGEEGLH